MTLSVVPPRPGKEPGLFPALEMLERADLPTTTRAWLRHKDKQPRRPDAPEWSREWPDHLAAVPEALAAAEWAGLDGTGLVPGAAGPLAVDLDGSRNPATDELAEWAKPWVDDRRVPATEKSHG